MRRPAKTIALGGLLAALAVLYAVLMLVMGLDDLTEEYRYIGFAGLALLMLLGNATFFLADMLLTRLEKKFKR